MEKSAQTFSPPRTSTQTGIKTLFSKFASGWALSYYEALDRQEY